MKKRYPIESYRVPGHPMFAAHKRLMAEKKLMAETITKAWPIGSEVLYSHGSRLIYAEVVDHCYTDVLVKGASGKDYTISAYRIVT